MKKLKHFTGRGLLITLFMVTGALCFKAAAAPFYTADDSLSMLIDETDKVLSALRDDHLQQTICLEEELETVNNKLLLAKSGSGLPYYAQLLEEKVRIQDDLKVAAEDFQVQMLRVRYIKGVELIKLLYEKVLGLDHHFTSIQTIQNIASLSNPNNFPDFQKNKKMLDERLQKKNGVKLPAVLQSNIYLSGTFSLIAALFGEGDSGAKEKDLEQISCILDFTLRMNNDLNTIFYETEFLKQNNQALKDDCMALFTEYIKPVGYFVTLDKCRKEDDWETVQEDIDATFKKMNDDAAVPASAKQSVKQQVNIGFSIDRLMDFMEKYSTFVNSGEKYYQKFLVIATNYQNETVCAAQLPRQFVDLRHDIELSIEKFNNSYKLSEIKGSKLKELLYGMPD